MLVLVLAAVTACTSSTRYRPGDKLVRIGGAPNIVFVLADDLSSNLLPFMPHVAALEREGATFSNYFVVDSLCCPSRTALFTGQYPHNNGVFTNSGRDGGYEAFQRFGNARKTWAVSLQKAGYVTGMMGKYLNRYQPPFHQPEGWDHWYVAGNGYHEYNYGINDDGRLRQFGSAPKDYLGDRLDQRAGQFVQEAVGTGKPFALEVATFAPHSPYTPAPQDLDTFPGLRAPRGPAYNRLPSNAPAWLAARSALRPRGVREIDHDFQRRVEAVQDLDRMIGHLQRELREQGLLGNTYFVFSSDNGYHMGEYRLLPGKQTAFDTDIKVPLVVTGPGIRPGTTINAVTQSIDIAPTFDDIAQATPADHLDGVSLLPLLHGEVTSAAWPQHAALIEHRSHAFPASLDPDVQPVASGIPPTYEAIRTQDALYVEYADGEREFYDLRSDPNEMDNLFATTPTATLTRYVDWLHALKHCAGTVSCAAAQRAGTLTRPRR